MIKRYFWCLCLILSACGGLGGPTATPDPLGGGVTLTSPPNGAVIYASALYVSGSLADVPQKDLLVRVIQTDGEILAEAPVNAKQGDWSVELIHGYTGDPLNATVQIIPAEAPTAGVITASEILFAPLTERPDGAFITLISPEDGREIGGDELLVLGTASGLEDRQLTVELTGDSGAVIAYQTIAVPGKYAIDEMPWSVALPLTQYEGNAVLRITAENGMEEAISVIVTTTAG